MLKGFILFTFCCLLAQSTFGQKIDPLYFSKDSVVIEITDTTITKSTQIYSYSTCPCAYLPTIPKDAPKHLYLPTIQIELWTYEPLFYVRLSPTKDTLIRPHFMYGNIKNGQFHYGTRKDILYKGKETIVLSSTQKQQLFKLLHTYREDYSKDCKVDLSEAMCYRPRHAIVFYENGKAIDFLEVCFECSNKRQSNPVFQNIFKCGEKYELLKEFFREVGIKYYLSVKPMEGYEVRKRK